MGVKHILVIMTILTVLFGCQVTQPGEVECTPPAVKMLDVNGNPVCVLPEIEEGETPAAPEEGGIIEDMGDMAEDVVEEVTEGAEEVAEEIEDVIEEPEEVPPVTGEVVSEPVQELPRREVTEGELVSFPNLAAEDPDGDTITYLFSEPLDDEGEWQTEVGDAGEYIVTITASDGVNEVSQDVLIVVLSANQAPTLELDDSIVVNEGQTVTLQPEVSDPEGDDITISYSGWMTSSTKRTGYQDAGEYVVTVAATDGTSTVTQDVLVIVQDVNQAPVLAPVADVTVDEGDRVVIEPTATDPDGDTVDISFSEPLDAAGEWQTELGDAGTYDVEVIASDGALTDSRSFSITVRSLNAPPVIDIASTVTVDEGQTVQLSPVVTDPDGDEITVTYSGWMTSSSKQTTFDDAGEYLVTVTADDGFNTVSKDVRIIVNNVNRPPRFIGI